MPEINFTIDAQTGEMEMKVEGVFEYTNSKHETVTVSKREKQRGGSTKGGRR